MAGQKNASSWTEEHTKLLWSLFERDPPIVDQQTTPKQLSQISKDFNEKIYKQFAYGTIGNKVNAAKKHFFKSDENAARNHADLLEEASSEEDSSMEEVQVPQALARPPTTMSVKQPPQVIVKKPDVLPLENEISNEKLFLSDTCPTVMSHRDSQKVKHYQVRWAPPQGVLSSGDKSLHNVIFPSIVNEGHALHLKFRQPKCLYQLEKAASLPCWDHIWGKSAFQGKAAMIEHELDLRDAYEQQGHIWAVQRVDFEEPINFIESFHLEGDGNDKCIIIALVGPDSDYKKRKLNENAILS